jgi:HTH-type transcriptional regulator/antitoxin MqsA
MTNPVDPNTGAPLHRDVRPLTLTYKGESITVDMPGWYGDQPDDGLHSAADMKVSDRALHRLKARAEGLPEPEEIRRIRRKLGLTQAEAGELIGGGPRAFQKYETGDYLPSRAVSSALMLLDHDPKSLEVLTARRASRAYREPTPIAPTRRTIAASR